MTSQFRTLGEFLSALKNQTKLETEKVVDEINSLVDQIAELNSQIERIELIGGEANSMSDQRDQFISELSELIGIQTIERDNGVVDVSAEGIPLVIGPSVNLIEAGYTNDGTLGISIVGSNSYITNVQGGTIGALLSLHNEIISGIDDRLDSLANAIVQEVNNYHVMGVGSAGSFSELVGQSLTSDSLSDVENISDGSFYIRMTNTSTGEITRHEITIDADNDTLSDVAAAISAVSGLTASASASNKLTIVADANYEFDFMPCVLPEPTMVDFDDASSPTVTVSGIYTGTENDTFDFTVVGDGSVGNGTLSLQVTNGDGDSIATLNIGSGYAAGDLLDIGNGIKITLSTGNLAQSDGDIFSVDAFADTDTSGFLTAAGMNTFFSGNAAVNMAVCSAVSEDPKRVATAIGAAGTDNENIARMAAIKDEALGSLGSLTCGEFYQNLPLILGRRFP